jgi:serine/threonine-protein kinase RsbW
MCSSLLEAPAEDEATGQQGDRWQWESLSSCAETLSVIDLVLDAMAQKGYPVRDCFGMRLALEEALVNAISHGNGGDPTKLVRVRCRVSPSVAWVKVEGQGAGFDPKQIPDPTDQANWQRPNGCGLLLMQSYMTWVRYRERSGCIALGKARSVPPPSSPKGSTAPGRSSDVRPAQSGVCRL